MRRWLFVVTAAMAGLAGAGVIGVAGAETTPAPITRGITVNGFATQQVPRGADSDALRAAYRTALSSALDDAKSKADVIAPKEGLTLGGVLNVTEQTDGNVFDCSIDFGAAGPLPRGGAPKARGGPIPSRGPARRRRGKVKGAAAPDPGTCPVEASATVTYSIG